MNGMIREFLDSMKKYINQNQVVIGKIIYLATQEASPRAMIKLIPKTEDK